MPALSKGASSIGMMEGAFFVGQRELLTWANEVFQLNLTKVEQCANGCVYASVIDACHPGKVNMRKLNWTARSEAPESITNYKVLQQGLDKCGIDRHVDVDKLVRGKYQDNLEMLQWIKAYFDTTYAGDGLYDVDRVRGGIQLPEWARGAGGAIAPAKENVQPRNNRRNSLPQEEAAAKPGVAPRGNPAPPRNTNPSPSAGRAPGSGAGGAQQLLEQLREDNRLQKEEIVDLRISVDGLESERDYYFGKLRDIEILCQTLEEKGQDGMTVKRLIQDVQTILYQKEDDDEGAAADPGGGAAGNPVPEPPGPPRA